MKRLIHTWVMAAALLSSTTSIAAPNDDVDFVTLASQLYRDGHYDRASAVLQSVQPEDLTDQRGDFETLAALLALRQSDFRSAVEHLHGALSAGRTEPAIYVQFAQAYWGLEDWKMVVQSVDNAGEAAANFPELYLMRAQALWRLERKRQALDALVQGSEKFPNNLEFQRQQVYLLLELGLNQTAIEVANAYISRRLPTHTSPGPSQTHEICSPWGKVCVAMATLRRPFITWKKRTSCFRKTLWWSSNWRSRGWLRASRALPPTFFNGRRTSTPDLSWSLRNCIAVLVRTSEQFT
ncbi:MAG: tetratricopeptide repeat protein [bacterium]